MTTPSTRSPDHPPTEHIELEELADAAEGLIDDARMRVIDAHLAGCSRCAADADALTGVQQTLASEPADSMPDDVFARLQSVVTAEQQQRGAQTHRSRTPTAGAPTTGAPVAGPGAKQPLAEKYSDLTGAGTSPRALRAKFAGGALAATLLAGTAGFGGYVASAAAGTDEPPAQDPMVSSTRGFADAAGEVRQGDPDAYTFSQTWTCVRKVTDGRVLGIKSGMVNGQSGYLVVVRDNGQTSAIFVTGCDTENPSAGPSAALPDR